MLLFQQSAVSTSASQISLGKARLAINPHSYPSSPDNGSTITHKFTHSNGSLARSAGLFVKVTCPIRHNLPNGLCNGDLHSHGMSDFLDLQ